MSNNKPEVEMDCLDSGGETAEASDCSAMLEIESNPLAENSEVKEEMTEHSAFDDNCEDASSVTLFVENSQVKASLTKSTCDDMESTKSTCDHDDQDRNSNLHSPLSLAIQNRMESESHDDASSEDGDVMAAKRASIFSLHDPDIYDKYYSEKTELDTCCESNSDVRTVNKIPSFLQESPKPIRQTRCESFVSSYGSCSRVNDKVRDYLCHSVVSISVLAARNPKFVILLTIFVSVSLLTAGYKTNFQLDVDFQNMFTPTGTRTERHTIFLGKMDMDGPEANQQLPVPGEAQRLLKEFGGQPMTMPDQFINSYSFENRLEHLSISSSLFQAQMPVLTNVIPYSFENILEDFNIAPSQASISESSNSIPNLKDQYHRDTQAEKKSEAQTKKTADRLMLLSIFVHADGQNVVGKEGMDRVVEVVDTIHSMPGYDFICEEGIYSNSNERQCQTYGVPQFWSSDTETYEQMIKNDQDAINILGSQEFPDQIPVDLPSILGRAKKDQNGVVTYGEAYIVYMLLPYSSIDSGAADAFSKSIIERTLKLRSAWANDPDSKFRLEIINEQSFPIELERSIMQDLRLVPIVFLIMIGFTALVFFKFDRVNSRCLLGLGGVICVLLSLCTSYGLMFIFGIPFTPMTTMLPFLIFGIGLDDTFIFIGAYRRTNQELHVVERIQDAMDEVALSIITTTMTTSLAFILGLITTIPAIYWVCLYAFPTVLIVFLYQITFFVALVVMDEWRIQANRADCMICCTVGKNNIFSADRRKRITITPERRKTEEKDMASRFMKWYADKLLQPRVRVSVILLFAAYFAFSIHRCTLMEQDFKLTDLVPKDSFVKDFIDTMEQYSTRSVGPGIYFRFVDHADERVQEQMLSYVDDIVSVPAFGEEPPFCWVRDFKIIREQYSFLFVNKTFYEQLDFLFQDPRIAETYGPHLWRNKKGEVVMSRCPIFINNLDLQNVEAQIETLRELHEVSGNHPMNKDREEWPFFMDEAIFSLWEFYSAAVKELVSTTIGAVLAVTIIGFFIIPHWSGMIFVFPTISLLYIDLIGTIQYLGVRINAVSYIALVISIGLMVDYIVHILIRYYESQYVEPIDKVKDTLETMGASILVGGLSTFLGACPLLLSSGHIMSTIAVSFFAMVTLSLLHGLVLLPVVLSYIGPTDTAIASKGLAEI